MPAYYRPEEDTSDLLEDKDKKLYIKLRGKTVHCKYW